MKSKQADPCLLCFQPSLLCVLERTGMLASMSSGHTTALYICKHRPLPLQVCLHTRMMGATSHLAVHHSRIFCFPISFSLDASLWEWVEVFWWELNGEFTRSHWSECLYPILSRDWSKTLITLLLTADRTGHATLLFSEIRQRKHPGNQPNMLAPFPTCLPWSSLLTVQSGSDKLSPFQKIQSQ